MDLPTLDKTPAGMEAYQDKVRTPSTPALSRQTKTVLLSVPSEAPSASTLSGFKPPTTGTRPKASSGPLAPDIALLKPRGCQGGCWSQTAPGSRGCSPVGHSCCHKRPCRVSMEDVRYSTRISDAEVTPQEDFGKLE